MNLYEAIFARKSVRSYTNETLSPQVLDKIREHFHELTGLFGGIDTAVSVLDNRKAQQKFLSLFSVRAPYYLAFYSEQAPRYLMNMGYLMEQMVLYLRSYTQTGESTAVLPARQAAAALERDTVQTKEALDQYLADRVRPLLPAEKRPLWDAPSMYGSPGRQTVGGAVVSFLLRPCAFGGQVVFGFRQGVHPTFTAPARWLGQPLPQADPDTAGRELVRRFLHCYGPATRQELIDWLGCSPAQGSRLWDAAAPGTAEVTLAGRTRRMLAADLDALPGLPRPQQAPLLLLGPHDPYLDQRDRTLLLPDKRLQRLVWRTVGNPGAILQQGRVAGCWKSKTRRGSLLVEAVFWQEPGPAARAAVQAKAEAWAAFRQMPLAECQFSVLA